MFHCVTVKPDHGLVPFQAGIAGYNSLGQSAPASSLALEPFVDANTVSAFFAIRRAEVLKLTREHKIRGYAYKGRLRHVYRNRPSEVNEDFSALLCQPKGTIPAAAPMSQRRKSNG